METLQEVLQAISILVITVLIQYRLPKRILGQRCSGILTLSIMLAVNFFASWLNMSLNLATDIGENTLYYGLFNLALYLLLFKGSVIKKVFLTVFIGCGLPIPFYVFLPFAHCFFDQATSEFLLALEVIEYVNIILSAVGMEYIGRKFQNLRRELPFGYTVYLTAVILFVYVAIYSAYGRMFMSNQFVVSLSCAITMAAFALTGTAIVVVAVFAVDRQVNASLKEQLSDMQAENFKSRELEWRRFSGFRHDIKNHLICLSKLLENEKTEQAASYMHNLTDTMKQFDNPVQTGNDYADALLSVKYAEAVEAGIVVSIEMTIPSQGFIEPVDLCCILSNAFDNAIAACNRMTEDKKWITARAFVRQNQLIISIKNSKPSYVTVVEGEVFPKEIAPGHGLGLDTVKAVVQKYSGVLKLSANDAFSFSVLLPQLRL